MSIATVLGSPRKKGNTNRVLAWVEQAFQESGNQVERLNLADYKINGCKGCYTCQNVTNAVGCPQKDDATDVLSHLLASDAVIYATPIYFWGPTAQMKALIDRHTGVVTGFGTPSWYSLMQGKHLGLVVTCADALEDNVHVTVELFKRFAHYLKCDYSGELLIPGTTKPEALGDDVKVKATAFAQSFADHVHLCDG